MSNRTLLFTLDIGASALHANARASHEDAARRWGCDYIVHREALLRPGSNPYEEKLLLDRRAAGYERVIYVDRDVVIRHDCPSLLELVPPGSFAYNPHAQDRYESLEDTERETAALLAPLIAEARLKVSEWDWYSDCFDSGVLVFEPALHAKVFEESRRLLPFATDTGWRVVDEGLLSVARKSVGATPRVLSDDYNYRGVGMVQRSPAGMAFPIHHFAGKWRKDYLPNAAWQLPPGAVRPPAQPRKYQAEAEASALRERQHKLWDDFHARPLAADLTTDAGRDAELAWQKGFDVAVARLPRCTCASSWMKLRKQHPPDLNSPAAYARWGWVMHDHVSARTRPPPPRISFEEAVRIRGWEKLLPIEPASKTAR